MLTFDPEDALPARKLLNYVLMMAARDGASTVRLEPHHRGSACMWYCVDGVWYELVPSPRHFWTKMKQVFKTAAATDQFHLGVLPIDGIDLDVPIPAPRRRWWQLRPVPVWTGGVLDHRFGEQTNRWVVILDERRGRESLVLTSLKPAGSSGDAEALLSRAFGRHRKQPEPTT